MKAQNVASLSHAESFCPNSSWESLVENDFVWFRKVWVLPDKLNSRYLCTTGAMLDSQAFSPASNSGPAREPKRDRVRLNTFWFALGFLTKSWLVRWQRILFCPWFQTTLLYHQQQKFKKLTFLPLSRREPLHDSSDCRCAASDGSALFRYPELIR